MSSSSAAVHQILEAGQARTANNLPHDASVASNPAAMSDKVLKEGAKTLGSQSAKGQADPELASLAQAAAQGGSRKPDAANVAAEVKSAVHDGVSSQHKDLASEAVQASAEKLNRRPHDKQVSGGGDPNQAAVDILKDAESELVRKEVHDKGGVQRGSAAAKIQSAADRVKEGTAGDDPAILKQIKASLNEQ